MKKYIAGIVCLLALTAVFSCRRSEQPEPIPPVPVKLVTKLFVSETDFQSFGYNGQKQVTSYISQWQSSPETISRIEYHIGYQDGRLHQQVSQAGRSTYEYQDGRPVKAANFTANGRKLSTHQFEYDTRGRLQRVTETMELPDEAEAVRMDFQYDENGNLRRSDHWLRKTGEETFTLQFSKIYEAYDTQPQPVPSPVWEHFLPIPNMHVNNPLRIVNRGPDGELLSRLHLQYQYGPDGYPIARTQRVEIDGVLQAPVVFEYQY